MKWVTQKELDTYNRERKNSYARTISLKHSLPCPKIAIILNRHLAKVVSKSSKKKLKPAPRVKADQYAFKTVKAHYLLEKDKIKLQSFKKKIRREIFELVMRSGV